MNRVYLTVWNVAKGQWQVAPETAKRCGKSSPRRSGVMGAVAALATSSPLLFPLSAMASGLPSGADIRAGSGSIEQSGQEMRIHQNSDRMAIDWDNFSVAEGGRVEFIQPGSDAAALNRVTSDQVSQIRGAIEANGQVFLVNPNGIVFGDTAQVDVGGLVASTLDISPEDFMSGDFTFEGDSSSAIINQGNIRTGEEGFVALIAAEIINEGSISAPRGDVMMGAGSRVTLDMGGPVRIEVEQALIDTYIEQGGAIKADGGRVYLTAKAAGDLAASVINHTGMTQARTLAENEQGEIWLMGDMDHGETHVAGNLDASALNSGDGGFIETSAAKVTIADETKVSTRADNGKTGEWLIDPQDYTIAAQNGDITGNALSGNLANTNVTIESVAGGEIGNGDIFVNDEVSWDSGNQLTLNAQRNIEINALIDASGGDGGKLALEFRQGNSSGEYLVNAPIRLQAGQNFSTKRGSGGSTLNFTVITQLSGGSGTSLEDLQGDGSNLSGRYALGADIDAGPTTDWNSGKGWRPIGSINGTIMERFNTRFNGTFTGLGNTIKNLTVQRPDSFDDRLYAYGLFGHNGENSTIRDIGLVGGSVRGRDEVGALIGLNRGTIFNAFAEVEVKGRDFIGGLAGSNYGRITNSYATGDVTHVDPIDGAGGGLVGLNYDAVIENSYATGTVTGENRVGGLLGSGWNTTLRNTYATGEVIGNVKVGGLVGRLNSLSGRTILENNYATSKVTAIGTDADNIGGLVGVSPVELAGNFYATTNAAGSAIDQDHTNSTGTGKTNAELTNLATFDVWGGNIDDQGGTTAAWRIYDGETTPLLRNFMTLVAVTPDSNSVNGKTYDGSVASGSAGFVKHQADATLQGGSQIHYTTNSADAGTYSPSTGLIITGLYSDQQGFDISYNAELTIDPRAITVRTDDQTKVYGDNDPELTWDITGGSLVQGDTLNGSPTRETGENVGDYLVDATSLENSNYAITSNSGTLTITQRAITVQADNQSKVYGNADPELTWSVTAGSLVGDDTLAGDLTRDPGNDVGNYTIRTNNLANDNYLIIANDGLLTVTRRAISIRANDQEKVYGDPDPELTWSVTDGNLVGDDTLSGDLARASGEDAGEYAISADALENGNYQITAQGGLFTIDQRGITVRADNANKTYGEDDPTLTWSVTNGSLVGDDTLSGDLARASGENAGEYAISADALENDNYRITAQNGVFTIDQRGITVRADNANKTYGEDDPALTWSVTDGNLVGDDTLSGDLARASGENAGEYTISADALENSNYQITAQNGVFTIDRRGITIRADNANKTYGEDDPTLSWQVTDGNLVGDDTLSGDLARASGEDAGEYTVSADALDNDNYRITAQDGLFTIDQRGITIRADNANKIYGENDPTLTWQVTAGNLVGDDTLSGNLVRASGEDAGEYAISANALENINYRITAQDGLFTINQREVTVRADNANKIYGENDPTLTWSVTDGRLVDDDTLDVDLARDAGKDIGNYIISADALDNNNYLITARDGVLTINPRAVTVSADNQEKIVGRDDPALTFTTGCGDLSAPCGLVSGEQLSGSLIRETGEDLGRYAIQQGNVTKAMNPNYTINFVDGELWVATVAELNPLMTSAAMASVDPARERAEVDAGLHSPEERMRQFGVMSVGGTSSNLPGGSIDIVAGGINTAVSNEDNEETQ